PGPGIEHTPPVIAARKCPPGMVYVAAGTFWMGSEETAGDPDERPRHEVEVDAFCLDATEVTNRDYEAFVPSRASRRNEYSPCPECPGVEVDWLEAKRYCESRGARLPTEAEWERAASSGGPGLYPWGDASPDGRANFCDASCPHAYKDASARDGYPYAAPV